MLTTNWQRPDVRFLCITPGAHTMPLILATAGLGQGRQCFGNFGEDRTWISKLPRRAWEREKTGTAAFDPMQATK